MLGTSHRRPIGLYAWDEVRPEESALGFLLRMAEENGHPSTDTTVMDVGVRRAGVARGVSEHIERLAGEARTTSAALLANSPVLRDDDKLVLRGHVVDKYLHFGARRLCPECIAESDHHRFWWDLVPVSTCPRHRLELLGACPCGARLGWRDAGVSICTHCGAQDRHRFERRLADPKVLRSDAYILSRFGVGPTESVQLLDALQMADVFTMLERIGSACEGYSREWRSAKTLGMPLGVVQARGFEALADGKLDEVLTRIYAGFIAAGGKPEEGFTSCYGWLYHWFSNKGAARFSPLLAEAFLQHGAARFPIAPMARLGDLPRSARRMLSVKEAAARAQVSKFALKSIGLTLGMIEERRGRWSVPAELVDRIARDLKGALSSDETQEKLGVGRRVILEIIENQSLLPALERGKHRNVYVFRPDDIDDLLEKLEGSARLVTNPSQALLPISRLGRGRATTIGSCVRMILDGRLQVREKLKGAIGLQGLFIDHDELMVAVMSADAKMVPLGAAARMMRLNSRGLSQAISLGIFPSVKKGARELPAKQVEAFAERFIMLGEIKERVGGYFNTLKDQIERAGFRPDKRLAKCLSSGYLRSEIEPFLNKLEGGEVTLEMAPSAKYSVIEETRRILAQAERPIPSRDILRPLRARTQMGPSNQDHFFYGTMWEQRQEFVHIEGAGWWPRARPYLGRTFPLDGPTPSQTEIVHQIVIQLLGVTDRPLSQQEILAHLKAQSICMPRADGECFVRRLFVRHADRIVKLTGLGYWDRRRPYPLALYDPATWSGKSQTTAQRTGLWIIKLLKELGRPLTRAELEPMLQQRGIDLGKTPRSFVGRATAEFSNEIVYLDRVGYWLKDRPWLATGYRPRSRKAAA
jgi:TniQ